jgi:hypothetical protein
MNGLAPQAARDAPAARRNMAPIMEVLAPRLPRTGVALEVASGTGQHVCAFAEKFPGLTWQPSDPDPGARESISAWMAESGLANIRQPLNIDVMAPRWWDSLEERPAAMLAINMVHISPWAASEGLMEGAGALLAPGALLYLYGPYCKEGRHTAPSNAAFDESLRARNSDWGVRGMEEMAELGEGYGLRLEESVAMPANNFSLVFSRF